jgi:hypothetical protein
MDFFSSPPHPDQFWGPTQHSYPIGIGGFYHGGKVSGV